MKHWFSISCIQAELAKFAKLRIKQKILKLVNMSILLEYYRVGLEYKKRMADEVVSSYNEQVFQSKWVVDNKGNFRRIVLENESLSYWSRPFSADSNKWNM